MNLDLGRLGVLCILGNVIDTSPCIPYNFFNPTIVSGDTGGSQARRRFPSLLRSWHAAAEAGRRHGRPTGRDGGGNALFLVLVVRSAASRQAIPRVVAWS